MATLALVSIQLSYGENITNKVSNFPWATTFLRVYQFSILREDHLAFMEATPEVHVSSGTFSDSSRYLEATCPQTRLPALKLRQKQSSWKTRSHLSEEEVIFLLFSIKFQIDTRLLTEMYVSNQNDLDSKLVVILVILIKSAIIVF